MEAKTSQTKTQQQPKGPELGERRGAKEGEVMASTGGPQAQEE